MPFAFCFKCKIVTDSDRGCLPTSILVTSASLTSGSRVLLSRTANNFLFHLRNKVFYMLLSLYLVF